MDRSDAGTSSTNPNTFTNEGGKADDAEGAQIIFFNNSNAGDGSTFTNKAGTVEDAFPGGVIFRDSSRAGSGNFINEGGAKQDGGGGVTAFADTSNGVSGTGRSVRVLLVMRRLVRPYRGALSQERLREKPEEIVLYDDHFAANWRRSFDWKKRS